MHQHHLRILKIVLIYLDTMKLLVMLVALTSDMVEDHGWVNEKM